MFIQTEQTPNPATLKFLPGKTVLEEGTADFKKTEETACSPLARRIFSLQGVQGVFFGRDFISVSKSDDTDWSVLKPMVLAVLMEHFSSGQPVISGPLPSSTDSSEDDDEITAQIKELLETRVRPAVMMDGGDIVFERFEDGIVFLQMHGACSGCPSSTATLKSGIENMLRHFIPEVDEVRPVTEYQ